MIPSRVTRGARGHSDPMDVDAVNSLSRLAKEMGHQVRAMGVVSAVEHIFNETAMHARAQASNHLAKANRAKSCPRVRAKARVKKTRENSKAQTHRNLQRYVPLTLPGTMVTNGMMTGVLLDGTKVGNKRMTLPQAHFRLVVWMSVPPIVRSGLNG